MDKSVNLILEGGGVKGLGLVGALSVLEAEGYSFKRVGGTSAGAIVAGLLAAGYNCSDLEKIMPGVPYQKFRDPTFPSYFGFLGKVVSLLTEKGIYEGDSFCKWYGDLLEQKGIKTFADLKTPLIVCTADISTGRLLHLPTDYAKLNMDPDKQLVSRAVRASMSIPFFYEPVRWGGRYLVDGGLVSNFPIDIFDKTPETTYGIKLSARPEANQIKRKITNTINFAEAILSTMSNAHDQMHLDDPAVIARTIFVDTGKIQSTNFDISSEQQKFLFEAGQKGAHKFLSSLEA